MKNSLEHRSKKQGLFYTIVIILVLLILTVIGYEFFIINNYPHTILFLISAAVLIVVLVLAAIHTRPDQLDNVEYRNSKPGQEQWNDHIKGIVDEPKDREL